jgi:hypothetical protein
MADGADVLQATMLCERRKPTVVLAKTVRAGCSGSHPKLAGLTMTAVDATAAAETIFAVKERWPQWAERLYPIWQARVDMARRWPPNRLAFAISSAARGKAVGDFFRFPARLNRTNLPAAQ